MNPLSKRWPQETLAVGKWRMRKGRRAKECWPGPEVFKHDTKLTPAPVQVRQNMPEGQVCIGHLRLPL